jgi:regulation of enolase protein 1 (concanavalin A-like superfamily)
MMKKVIVLFIFCLLTILFYSTSYSSELPQDVNICDCNFVLPNAYLFDDFNDTFVLNWTILNENPSYWSLKSYPGTLNIITQDGAFERTRTDYKNVFLTNFPLAQSQDFQVTTCISNFNPYGLWNQAGLILWNDKDNYFKFDYEYGEGPPPNNKIKLLFIAEVEINGTPNFGWFEAQQIPAKMWLRIIKQGNLYKLFNSTDGQTYNPMKVLLPARMTNDNTVPCLTVPLKYLGVYANNGGSSTAPSVNASFEFFEFQWLSKDPNSINISK